MADVQREVEQFLYREARLLDTLRLREWVELFTDDARYWMPLRTVRYTKESKAITAVEGAQPARDEAGEDALAVYDDTKDSLTTRIARLETGLAWAEDPPSRTRHIITNVEVEPTGADSEVMVYSNFVVHRARFETEADVLFGQRQDVLRKVDGAWRIASRKILLDDSVFGANNLSIFL